MERLRITNLKPGMFFPDPIFSPTGHKLLNANSVLTDRHISAISRGGDFEVIVAKSVDELMSSGEVDKFDSSRLTVGEKSKSGVISRNGQVVLEPGQEVEEHHLHAIAAGGEAYVSRTEPLERRERILMADALVEELLAQIPRIELRITPAANTDWIQPAPADTWPDEQGISEVRTAAVESLRKIFAQIEAGVAVPSDRFDPILDDLMQRLAGHPTRFPQLALFHHQRDDYMSDHAYTVAVLAMAIGAQMRWSQKDVRRVGFASLTFDLGMLLVAERIRIGACELTEVDRTRVQRHPIFSLSMLQNIKTVEPAVQLAAFQHHERENGSGYPRGIRKDATCDLARVIAVADSYAATTEHRTYRKSKLPYVAMEEMLRSTTALALWKPAARALIQAAGLFPVGSYVRLSNGKNAKVISSNAQMLDRPAVQPVHANGKNAGDAIDMAQVHKESLTIVRPIPGPTG